MELNDPGITIVNLTGERLCASLAGGDFLCFPNIVLPPVTLGVERLVVPSTNTLAGNTVYPFRQVVLNLPGPADGVIYLVPFRVLKHLQGRPDVVGVSYNHHSSYGCPSCKTCLIIHDFYSCPGVFQIQPLPEGWVVAVNMNGDCYAVVPAAALCLEHKGRWFIQLGARWQDGAPYCWVSDRRIMPDILLFGNSPEEATTLWVAATAGNVPDPGYLILVD